MRNGLVLEQLIGVIDQEARGIEHDHHFRQQGLDIGFAGFAGDRLCDSGLIFVEQMLKLPQYVNSLPNTESIPVCLRIAATRHRIMYSDSLVQANVCNSSPVAGFTDLIFRSAMSGSVAINNPHSPDIVHSPAQSHQLRNGYELPEYE